MTDTAQGKFFVANEPLSHEEQRGVYRAILTRRDVRSQFSTRAVPPEVLSRILLAAHYAPSVGFMQPWNFIVIQNKSIRQRIHEEFLKANAEAATMFPQERQDQYKSLKLEGIREAPINICITCDPQKAGPVVLGRTHNSAMDAYSSVCAVQNLWLAARAEGVGIGWVSIIDHDKLRDILQIPKQIIPIAYLCLGWVDQAYAKPELEAKGWRKRLDISEVVSFDTWLGEAQHPALSEALSAGFEQIENHQFIDNL